MEFCKTFNARTQQMEKGMPIPVIITYYQDKSFSLELKTPPASYLLKKAAKIDGGSKKPGLEFKGTVTQADLKQIAEVKMKDLNANDVEQAMKIIAGSARSMGIEVKG
jgi:large subunit ribosomal protein L11